MVLSWEAGTRLANEYIVYRYNPSDPYSVYTQIGSVSAGNTNDSGSYSMTISGLGPNTTYQYVATGNSLVYGESVYSETAIGTTLAQNSASLNFDDPVNRSAALNGTTTFSVSVTDWGGYQSANFQWQEKLSGGNWSRLSNTGGISGANTSILTVTATSERNHAQYRCIVYGVSADATSVPYYSSAAFLTVATRMCPPL